MESTSHPPPLTERQGEQSYCCQRLLMQRACIGCAGTVLSKVCRHTAQSLQHSHEGHDTVLQADLHVLKQEAVLAAAQRVQHSLVLRTAGSKTACYSSLSISAHPIWLNRCWQAIEQLPFIVVKLPTVAEHVCFGLRMPTCTRTALPQGCG